MTIRNSQISLWGWLTAIGCAAMSPLITLAQSPNPVDKPLNFPLVGDFGPANVARSRIIDKIPTMRFVPPVPAMQGVELKDANKTYSAEVIRHYNEAVELHQQGNLDDALAKYRAVLNIDKNFSQAWCNLGGIYAYRKLNPQAIEAFKQALETSTSEAPYRISILRGLAGVYVAQGSYAEAEPLYKEAIANGPAGWPTGYYAVTMHLYASLLRKMNRVKEAEDMESRARRVLAGETAM